MEEKGTAFKLNNGEVAVGFDLTDTYSQISIASMDSDQVETLAAVAGSSNYRIPTALFKRKEVNQWFAGREAIRNRDNGQDGFFVDGLLERGAGGGEIKVGEESYSASALIALFMKRTMSLVSMMVPLNKIVSFTVTVDNLDNRLIGVLSEAVASLGLKTQNIFFQSHMESFYCYNIYQDINLWEKNVLLIDFSGEYVKSYRMECNKNTTPIVAFIDPNSYPHFETAGLDEMLPDSEEAKAADARLLKLVEDSAEGRLFSAIYFIGENFKQQIFKESVRYMCRKGRVFEGNNLYSKGAAYSAKDRLQRTIISESHVFLGNDKLKSNVGINVIRHGENSYMALLDAGVNWFEAKNQCEVILDKGNKLSFVITPLTGKNPEVVEITLFDLPKRPPKTSRLRLSLSMLSETSMQVEVKDLGFGELFPASEIEWKEVINV